MSAINGIIQGGASIISSLIAARAASESNKNVARIAKETREFNKEQNDIKYQRDKEMWHAANAYNSPLAQRQRFEEAGINPFLALGRFDSGTASALQSPTPTPASDYGYQSPLGHLAEGIAGGAQGYIQGELAAAQIANLKADTFKKEADAEGQLLNNKNFNRDLNARIANLEANTGKTKAEAALLVLQSETEKSRNSFIQEQIKTQMETTEGIELDNKIKNYKLEHLMPLEAEQARAVIANTWAMARHYSALTGLAEAQTQEVMVNVALKKIEERVQNATAVTRVKQAVYQMLGDRSLLVQRMQQQQNEQRRLEQKDVELAQEWTRISLQGVDLLIEGAAAYATGGLSLAPKALSKSAPKSAPKSSKKG